MYDVVKLIFRAFNHKRLTQKELYKITFYNELETKYITEHKNYVEVVTKVGIRNKEFLCRYRQRTVGKNEGHVYHFAQLYEVKHTENDNVPHIVISCGPSGSGKTRLYKLRQYDSMFDYVYISPDEIRKQLSNDISDQSKNEEVWDIAYSKLRNAVCNKQNVYFDATFCTLKSWKNIVYQISLACYGSDNKCDAWVIFDLFPYVKTEILKKRVKRDIHKKIDRSNTLKKIVFENKCISVIGKQNIQYESLLENYRKMFFDFKKEYNYISFFVVNIHKKDLIK